MADKTSTNVVGIYRSYDYKVDDLYTSLPSSHIHRHDFQIELNDYYINYVDDLITLSGADTTEINKSQSSNPELLDKTMSCEIEISQLPEEIFENENIRREFECIFHEFDPEVKITYSKFFQQAYLTFSDPMLALQVRRTMNEKEFHNKKIQISYSQSNSSPLCYLKPPKQERIYMQSPPATPPIGWIEKREELSDINFDLFLALSKLHPHEPFEILPKQSKCPAIVVHPSSDMSDDDVDSNVNDDTIKLEAERAQNINHQAMESKSNDHLLLNKSFVSVEQQIKQSVGDGDKLI